MTLKKTYVSANNIPRTLSQTLYDVANDIRRHKQHMSSQTTYAVTNNFMFETNRSQTSTHSFSVLQHATTERQLTFHQPSQQLLSSSSCFLNSHSLNACRFLSSFIQRRRRALFFLFISSSHLASLPCRLSTTARHSSKTLTNK